MRKAMVAGTIALLVWAVPAGPAQAHTARVSWYSLPGHRTADGERYCAECLTAASRTLPFGTQLVLCVPGTARCVNVRVNDRGPFIRGRDLDVTMRVARFLGILHTGVARIEVLGG